MIGKSKYCIFLSESENGESLTNENIERSP
jgi:hypothetical protein